MQLARHNSELFQLRDRCQNKQSSLAYFDGMLLPQKKTIAVFTIYGDEKACICQDLEWRSNRGEFSDIR